MTENELRELAEDATPGKWGSPDMHDESVVGAGGEMVADIYNDRDGRYIVAMQPDTTIALLTRIAQLRALCGTLYEIVVSEHDTPSEGMRRLIEHAERILDEESAGKPLVIP